MTPEQIEEARREERHERRRALAVTADRDGVRYEWRPNLPDDESGAWGVEYRWRDDRCTGFSTIDSAASARSRWQAITGRVDAPAIMGGAE